MTGHHDDEQGLHETYGPGTGSRFYRLIGETSTLVAVINAALAGVVVGLVANAAGTGSELSLFIGAVVTTVLVVSLVNTSRRLIERGASLARAPLRTIGRERYDRAHGVTRRHWQHTLRSSDESLVDVQLVQERERVVEGLEQILAVLDHLAAHVDAEPLLERVQLVPIEHVPDRKVTLGQESRQIHRTLEAERTTESTASRRPSRRQGTPVSWRRVVARSRR